MKTTTQNPVIGYLLNRPVATVLFLVAFFAASIALDQSLHRDSLTKTKEFGKIENSLNTNYVAWSSTNPAIIAHLKDSKAKPNITEGTAYFASFKTTTERIIRYIEIQINLFRKITELRNRG